MSLKERFKKNFFRGKFVFQGKNKSSKLESELFFSILVGNLISLLVGWFQLRKNSTFFLIVTAEFALLGFFVSLGPAYTCLLKITKKWEVVLLGMILSLSLSSLAFLLLVIF